jgi:Asp-tRNA(Asn)/Glu-tRNA(Gln) amidotransferase A subunit family amidase
VSPSTRTGATGLRPTFGRVSRHGAMALSWTMDKIGPIARSAEDCALVFAAIHGADGRDPTARTLPFRYDGNRPLSDLRIGYLESGFEREPWGNDEDTRRRARQQIELEQRALEVVRGLGVDPVPVQLPGDLPVDALRIILNAEAAAAFDELTRSGRDELLVSQERWSWPNAFREARMIPAVEYLQASRIRTMLMGEVDRALDGIDVFITPSYADDVLLTTNLTGHPTAVAPAGFIDGHPMSISFVGGLWQEEAALRLAAAYQQATDFHSRVPPGFG